jgi:hypothetical protein
VFPFLRFGQFCLGAVCRPIANRSLAHTRRRRRPKKGDDDVFQNSVHFLCVHNSRKSSRPS